MLYALLNFAVLLTEGLRISKPNGGPVCLIEGDIRCPWDSCHGSSDFSCINKDDPGSTRFTMKRYINAPKDFSRLWVSRKVPYVLGYDYPQSLINLLRKAIETIERSTCVRFEHLVSPPSSGDYVMITRMKGCWSDIGRRGGIQVMSLDIDCFDERTVFHELLHTLGFWHEHNRADRDLYIRVNRENIDPSQIANFKKKPAYISERGDFPYDYYSPIHYKATQYSRDGKKPTMAPLSKEVRIEDLGSSVSLTRLDISKISLLYNCNSSECRPPLLGEGVVMIGNDFRVGSVLEFACDFKSMKLVGSLRRTCQANGQWSGHRARCIFRLLHYCNFESGSCGWTNVDSLQIGYGWGDGPWVVSSGLTYHREGTGPMIDFTSGSVSGHFMHLDSKNLDPYLEAIIRSPVIQAPETGLTVCVTFGYHLWGREVGVLVLSMIDDSGELELIRKSGSYGPRWMKAKTSFVPSSKFQLQFKGIIASELGDMAFDDVVIEICTSDDQLSIKPQGR